MPAGKMVYPFFLPLLCAKRKGGLFAKGRRKKSRQKFKEEFLSDVTGHFVFNEMTYGTISNGNRSRYVCKGKEKTTFGGFQKMTLFKKSRQKFKEEFLSDDTGHFVINEMTYGTISNGNRSRYPFFLPLLCAKRKGGVFTKRKKRGVMRLLALEDE